MSSDVWSVMIFNCVIICGNSLSMASREVTAFAIWASRLSMPSSASNSDSNVKCPTQRDAETVWLPIEIVLERPQEIVEVRDPRIHLIGDLL